MLLIHLGWTFFLVRGLLLLLLLYCLLLLFQSICYVQVIDLS